MKKAIFMAAMLVCASAFATGPSNNNGDTTNNTTNNNQTYNQPSATGNGGQGGTGGNAAAGAAALAGAQADVRNTVNTAIDASTRSNAESSVASLNKNDSKATSSGNSTSVSVGGDNVERSAPAVFAGNIPSVARSCRLYMFGGGSNVNGSIAGSIPLGNDQTCLSGAKLDYMAMVNKLYPAAYSQQSFIQAACEVEGMDVADECKALAKK